MLIKKNINEINNFKNVYLNINNFSSTNNLKLEDKRKWAYKKVTIPFKEDTILDLDSNKLNVLDLDLNRLKVDFIEVGLDGPNNSKNFSIEFFSEKIPGFSKEDDWGIIKSLRLENGFWGHNVVLCKFYDGFIHSFELLGGQENSSFDYQSFSRSSFLEEDYRVPCGIVLNMGVDGYYGPFYMNYDLVDLSFIFLDFSQVAIKYLIEGVILVAKILMEKEKNNSFLTKNDLIYFDDLKFCFGLKFRDMSLNDFIEHFSSFSIDEVNSFRENVIFNYSWRETQRFVDYANQLWIEV